MGGAAAAAVEQVIVEPRLAGSCGIGISASSLNREQIRLGWACWWSRIVMATDNEQCWIVRVCF